MSRAPCPHDRRAGRPKLCPVGFCIGMTFEQLQQLFQPFVTKTRHRHRPWLTLSEHRRAAWGHITVSSARRGTAFTVYLPNVESATAFPPGLPIRWQLAASGVRASTGSRTTTGRRTRQTSVGTAWMRGDRGQRWPTGITTRNHEPPTTIADLSAAVTVMLPRFAQLPCSIIALTDGQIIPDEDTLHEMGLRAVLTKPFRHDDLLAAVKNVERNP